MTEPDLESQMLATIRDEIAAEEATAAAETDPVVQERRRVHAGIRAEVDEEEAAAIAAEITENNYTALSLRVPESLSLALKQRAAAEHIPISALVRRLLIQAMDDQAAPVLTVEQVEEIARRIYNEPRSA